MGEEKVLREKWGYYGRSEDIMGEVKISRDKWGYKRRSNEVQEKNYAIFIILRAQLNLYWKVCIEQVLFAYYIMCIIFIYSDLSILYRECQKKTFPAVKSELWMIALIIGTAKIKTILTDYDLILYIYVQIFDSKHQKCILLLAGFESIIAKKPLEV